MQNRKLPTNYEKTKSLDASIISILLVLFWFLCLFNLVNGQSSIRVFNEAKINRETLTLGDISKISAEKKEIANRLKTISLGFIPTSKLTHEVFKDRILLAIFAAGFQQNEFVLDSPPKVVIRRETQIIRRESLQEVIENALLREFQNKNLTLKIVRLDLPESLEIPTGSLEISANLGSVNNFFTPFSVSFEVRINGKTFRRLSTTAQIEATAEVLIAEKNLSAGKKLSPDDFRKETKALKKMPNKYLFDAEKLKGMYLSRNIVAGEELLTEYLFSGYVVKAGDTVKIIGESENLQLSLLGEARTSGKIGDRIAVKNSQSGVIFQAVVIDEGLVKIRF